MGNRAGAWRTSLIVSASMVLQACAGAMSTRVASTDYNRTFAGARGDMILLNVLRAAEREPLQFSTLSQIQGSVRPGISLKVPFTNVIAGGADAISPEITLGARNPGATIAPLESREFMAAIVRPVSYTTINDLMTNGPWPADALVLSIGGVQCGRGRVINSGSDPAVDNLFRTVLSTGLSGFEWKPSAVRTTEMIVPVAQALPLLDDNLTGSRRISIRPVQPEDENPLPPGPQPKPPVAPAGTRQPAPQQTRPIPANGNVVVAIQEPQEMTLAGPSLSTICDTVNGTTGDEATGVIIRSVQSMFYYLAELHRRNGRLGNGRCTTFGANDDETGLATFRLRSYCEERDAPVNAVLSAAFNGRTYFIPRHEDTASGRAAAGSTCNDPANALRGGLIEVPTPPETTGTQKNNGTRKTSQPVAEAAAPETPGARLSHCDRTLILVSILGELLALQTSDATLATSRPIIAISPQ